MRVITGLERLLKESAFQNHLIGKVGLLTNSAAVTSDFEWSVVKLKALCGDKLIKLFGPQHGLLTTVQDNMIETPNFVHPHWKLPVFSLYSTTRVPTEEMLDEIDTMVIDLQDVGCRIYTYIYTMSLMMEKISEYERTKGRRIKILVLDRPNPVGGELVEGNILDPQFTSFVGRHGLPVRHGLTIGEVALWVKSYENINVDLKIVPMLNWNRSMAFAETGLPWVIPSPNLATADSAFTFLGTVLFEGTNISEGRGTVRALEILGHPLLDGYAFVEKILPALKERELKGMILRPISFMPTFNKHQGVTCNGFQIHVTDYKVFKSWRLGQFLLAELYKELGNNFLWKNPPYEYEYTHLPIDVINGSSKLREWVEDKGDWQKLLEIEAAGLPDFMAKRKEVLIYK